MAIVGRTDQMLKIKGSAVFPLQIEEAILAVPGVSAHLIEVRNDEKGQEQIIVTVDTDSKNIIERVKEKVKTETNVTPRVKHDTRENIEKVWYCEGRVKPRKFWDKRL